MEHEMKISPSVIRRLRTERGWSQEQLAIASGLSLRTVQRVEAEGIASTGTAVSLAATFEVRLIDLQEEPRVSTDRKSKFDHIAIFSGLAVISIAAIGESGRLPGLPQSDFLAALNISVPIVGGVLVIPALARILRQRQCIGALLVMLGTPLATLLAAGAIFALVSGRLPSWPLAGIGAGGAALVVMAVRELKRFGNTAKT